MVLFYFISKSWLQYWYHLTFNFHPFFFKCVTSKVKGRSLLRTTLPHCHNLISPNSRAYHSDDCFHIAASTFFIFLGSTSWVISYVHIVRVSVWKKGYKFNSGDVQKELALGQIVMIHTSLHGSRVKTEDSPHTFSNAKSNQYAEWCSDMELVILTSLQSLLECILFWLALRKAVTKAAPALSSSKGHVSFYSACFQLSPMPLH